MKQATGIVKFAAEDRVSQSGRPYCSVAVEVAGQDGLVRLFGPPGHEPFQQLQRGQQVAIAFDHAGKAHLLEQTAPMGFHAPAAQPQPTVQPQAQPVYQHHQAAPAAPAAADPVIDMAASWHRAFDHLVRLGVDPSLAAPAASTITIQLGRR